MYQQQQETSTISKE